jgi:regulator of protease activity HflC (stomatin/prohibitin superfamily)
MRLESAASQFNTNDNMAVLVSASINWQIAEPEKFIRSPETLQAAEEALLSRLQEKINQAVGKYDLSSLVNVDTGQVKLPEMATFIREQLHGEVLAEYGIAVPQVRITRLGLTETTSKAVIDTIVEERKAAASRYRSEGEARALAIKERAKTSKEMILAFAERKAGEIRAKGEAASAKYYEMLNANRKFASLLRILEADKIKLQNHTQLFVTEQTVPSAQFFEKGLTSEALEKADLTNAGKEEN